MLNTIYKKYVKRHWTAVIARNLGFYFKTHVNNEKESLR